MLTRKYAMEMQTHPPTPPTVSTDPRLAATVQDTAAFEASKAEKFKLRLDAESSVGVSAALVGSFALSLVPNAKDIDSGWQQWGYVLGLALSGALCLGAMIVTATIYWAGCHILSASNKQQSVYLDNMRFKTFWKHESFSRARRWSRRAFQASIPLFLFSVALGVASDTGSNSLATTVAVVFVGVIVAGAHLSHAIEREVLALASGTK